MVAAIVIIIGAVLIFSNSSSTGTTQTDTNVTDTTGTGTGTGADTTGPVAGTTTDTMAARTVTYNGSTFEPALVTIRAGGTVTFTSTAGPMWVASAPHPAHTAYDGTSRETHCAAGYTGPTPFDQCSAGTSYTVTLNKVGTWGYHDHINAAAHGQVTVVAQ